MAELCPTLRFNGLYKINGPDAIRKKGKIPTYPLATALFNEQAYARTSNPEAWSLGYYADPISGDIWMASNGITAFDKSELDAAKSKSSIEFEKVFAQKKNAVGIRNQKLALNSTKKTSQFVKATSGNLLEGASQLADSYAKASNPDIWSLGYYRDPQKPTNIWVAGGNAKFVLDSAKSDSLAAFRKLFKQLKTVDGIRPHAWH
jgi:hypothetical protein